LAQALLGRPELLLLDEPTAGLDPEQRLRFRQLVSGEDGRTVILSTHQTEDVAALCGRVLVLAHGYIRPSDYEVGEGLVREQAYFAANGYVVLHTDYRNHGRSDADRHGDVRRPLGYPADLVNAVKAVREAELPFVDADRIGIFGRSMGGGVALQSVVAQPDLVDAAVLYAPVSSRAADNFDRWVRGRDEGLEQRLVRRYGTPETDPAYWADASASSYLDRVAVPLQIHHGTVDDVCPFRWSESTA
jgi:dipeptidyl aminopeptidase/acylaminoacyl peptidase